jgi:hypothetical protein
MRQVVVRYKAKPERVEENEELVRGVYYELRRTEEFQKHSDGGKRLGLADDLSTRTGARGTAGPPS